MVGIFSSDLLDFYFPVLGMVLAILP